LAAVRQRAQSHDNELDKKGAPQNRCLPYRSVFIWAMVILVVGQLVEEIRRMFSVPAGSSISEFRTMGIFPCVALYAVFRLLWSNDSSRKAQTQDVLVVAGMSVLGVLTTASATWIAAAGIAAYMLVSGGRDLQVRAAAVVLAALSVQQFWGRILFEAVSLPLLRAETAVVGALLQVTQPGSMWHDNVISTQSGHGIIVYPYCSSFHNVSLALLCWITVAKLKDLNWKISDYLVGALVICVMIVLNTGRLYLMALDIMSYRFWHSGMGADIFAVIASVSVLLLSLYGPRLFVMRS
jgi:hypothetical protein